MTRHPAEFIGSMNAAGYLQFIAAVQVLGGLLLLIGRYVPLGLTLLCPIVYNIVVYHLCMDHGSMPIAIVVSVLALFLLWRYRAAFAGILRAQEVPGARGSPR